MSEVAYQRFLTPLISSCFDLPPREGPSAFASVDWRLPWKGHESGSRQPSIRVLSSLTRGITLNCVRRRHTWFLGERRGVSPTCEFERDCIRKQHVGLTARRSPSASRAA